MILDWIGSVPALVFAVALLIVPGLPAAWLAGFRGPLLIATSAVATLAVAAAASIAAPMVHVPWSIIPVLIGSVVLAIVVGLIAGFRRRERPVISGPGWVTLVVAAAVWTALLAYGMGRPDNPAQHFDALFHLNAVQYVIDRGDASSFHMTLAYPGRHNVFYPALWHAMTSLIVPVAGGVFEATNLMSIVVCGVLWPAGIMLLTAAVWPTRRLAIRLAPLATLGAMFFPMGFLNWGVLYPNLLGNALVPTVLALVVLVFRSGLPWRMRGALALLTIGAAGACALGHPSSLLLALAMIVPFFIERLIVLWREGTAARWVRIVLTVGLAGAVAVLLAAWLTLGRGWTEWQPNQSPAQAIGEAFLLAPLGRPVAALLVVLVVVGAVAVIRRRSGIWMIGAHLVTVVFFLVAVSMQHQGLRQLIVGLWYADLHRLAANLVVASLPLAAVGAECVLTWGRGWVTEAAGRARIGRIAAAVVVLAVLGAPQFLVVRNEARVMTSLSFAADDDVQGLSPDERALFAKAAEIVPDDSPVIGDPLTGAGLLYAAEGVPVVFPHVFGRFGEDATLLGKELNQGGDEVCAALERTNVTYALDLGERRIYDTYNWWYLGLHDLDDSDMVTEIARVGDAALFEITGCD